MLLKPRLYNEYIPTSGETTLNKIYPQNKNIFFYLGTRAENKFYHHASGTPNCYTAYTRVTSGLTCIETCACCNRTVTELANRTHQISFQTHSLVNYLSLRSHPNTPTVHARAEHENIKA